MIKISPIKNRDGVYTSNNLPGIEFLTKNLIPGVNVYNEQLISYEGVEYREWNFKKSKLASSMQRNLFIPNLKEGSSVLYLGASNGTTVSHVSDIIGEEGIIYAVEFSPRSMRDLYNLARIRPNIIPILADARYPEEYADIVSEVDIVYCDVAQANQSEILASNSHAFLKQNGYAFITIKTRSISQKKEAKRVFDEQIVLLNNLGLETVETGNISRVHREHYIFMGQLANPQ